MRVVLLLLFFSTTAFAQSAQKEINEQVWKPFIKGFSERNTEIFMGVHSKDLVRSPRDNKQVLNWETYYNETDTWNKQAKGRLQIELHFSERINNENQAIDVGIYKTTSFSEDGKSRVGYGRFHVVLRKEDNVWKILVDTDSNEGRTIGETQFAAAKPME